MAAQGQRHDHREKVLSILCFDSGGARGVSQLRILAELMQRINYEHEGEDLRRPCEIFDMIGGSGTGGLISIFLVSFGMTADQALDEFGTIDAEGRASSNADPESERTVLNKLISSLLGRYNIPRDAKLSDFHALSRGCKLVIPTVSKSIKGLVLKMKNFQNEEELPQDTTIYDAVLSTLAGPPPFLSTGAAPTAPCDDSELRISNAIQEVVSEANDAFGGDQYVSCLVSLGCGYPGVTPSSTENDPASWNTLRRVLVESEKSANKMDAQLGRLAFYYRFSAARGLEADQHQLDPGAMVSHTMDYLNQVSISRAVDQCTKTLNDQEGVVTLDYLKKSGGGERILPISLPPLTRHFVMRREPWAAIEEMIFGDKDVNEQPRRIKLILTGIGGCGKTQMILKFIRVHSSKFSANFFIDGGSRSSIKTDVVRHVRSLGVEHSQKLFEECLTLLSQLAPTGPRLIVYDNVDDPQLDLEPLLPQGDHDVIIITSRNRALGSHYPEAHIELDVMTLEEAVELLMRASGRSNEVLPPEQVKADAVAIAQALGCLPIALTQAYSYMFQTKCSGRAYLERLQENNDIIMAQPAKYQRDMRYTSTYAAFNASHAMLHTRDQKLLSLLSFFNRSKFPLDLILLAAKHGFSSYDVQYLEPDEIFIRGSELLKEIFLRSSEWDAHFLSEMVLALQNYSLIMVSSTINTRLVEMHPVAHAWAQSHVSEEGFPIYRSAAVALLALGARVGYYSSTQYLANHVNHVSVPGLSFHVNDRAAFVLIFQYCGMAHEAMKLQEGIVEELKTHLAPNHSSFIQCTARLASIYADMKQQDKAGALRLEVYQKWKEELGDNHPTTLKAADNLAVTYRRLGRYREAEKLQVEVLRIRRDVLGWKPPEIHGIMHNLGNTYNNLGRYKEAEKLHLEILKCRMELLGEEHPNTLAATESMACTYNGLGRYREAAPLLEKVVRLRKKWLGERNHYTIESSLSLAHTRRNLGKLAEAETVFIEVVNLRTEMLGAFHRDTLLASGGLALTYFDMGHYSQARQMQEDIFKQIVEMRGEDHQDTASARGDLAGTYRQFGDYEAAVQMQTKTLETRRSFFGDQHLLTLSAANNLAITTNDLGQHREAKIRQLDVLRVLKEAHGDHHPYAIQASTNLAIILQDMGDLAKAKDLFDEVVKTSTHVLGADHPSTLRATLNLAYSHLCLGEVSQATLQLETAQPVIVETLEVTHPLHRLHDYILALTKRVNEHPGSIENQVPAQEPPSARGCFSPILQFAARIWHCFT